MPLIWVSISSRSPGPTPLWTATPTRSTRNRSSRGGLDGNRVPYIPEFQFMLGLTITVRKFGFTLSGSFVDRTFTTASNTTDQFTPGGVPDSRFGTTDSYFVVDFSLYYEIKPGVRVLGGIQNVLGDEYIASRHPSGPRPGKPFFAYVGMEFRF